MSCLDLVEKFAHGQGRKGTKLGEGTTILLRSMLADVVVIGAPAPSSIAAPLPSKNVLRTTGICLRILEKVSSGFRSFELYRRLLSILSEYCSTGDIVFGAGVCRAREYMRMNRWAEPSLMLSDVCGGCVDVVPCDHTVFETAVALLLTGWQEESFLGDKNTGREPLIPSAALNAFGDAPDEIGANPDQRSAYTARLNRGPHCLEDWAAVYRQVVQVLIAMGRALPVEKVCLYRTIENGKNRPFTAPQPGGPAGQHNPSVPRPVSRTPDGGTDGSAGSAVPVHADGEPPSAWTGTSLPADRGTALLEGRDGDLHGGEHFPEHSLEIPVTMKIPVTPLQLAKLAATTGMLEIVLSIPIAYRYGPNHISWTNGYPWNPVGGAYSSPRASPLPPPLGGNCHDHAEAVGAYVRNLAGMRVAVRALGVLAVRSFGLDQAVDSRVVRVLGGGSRWGRVVAEVLEEGGAVGGGRGGAGGSWGVLGVVERDAAYLEEALESPAYKKWAKDQVGLEMVLAEQRRRKEERGRAVGMAGPLGLGSVHASTAPTAISTKEKGRKLLAHCNDAVLRTLINGWAGHGHDPNPMEGALEKVLFQQELKALGDLRKEIEGALGKVLERRRELGEERGREEPRGDV